MSEASAYDWTEANQACLVAEFARLKALLRGQDPAEAAAAEAASRSDLERHGDLAAVDLIARHFQLSRFERDLLLLCAGVEMDAGLAQLCAEAQDNPPQRRWANFGLALGALPEPHWSALTPMRPLRRLHLIGIDEGANLGTARLRIDERILHYLAGINYLDRRLQPLLHAWTPADLMAAAHTDAAGRIATQWRAASGAPPLVQLHGDDRSGQKDVAAGAAARLGMRLYVLAAADIPVAPQEQETLAALWEREATLLGGAMLIACDEHSEAARTFAGRLEGMVVLAAREPLRLERASLRVPIDRPDPADQKGLWKQALGDGATRLNGALDGVASQFRLSARSIGAIGDALAPSLATDSDADADSGLWNACRGLDGSHLDDLAQRIRSSAGWDDLVLPDAQTATLRQIAGHLRHRLKVHEAWGFAAKSARGLGIGALFAGDSGTGKTMAAEVLAAELGLDLYRIDLSAVVSKYIGETEKNLRRVFDAAEESGAILLFDEADALFGKRSEVKDSHDRYANIEVGYLLQRMESYRGLAILTTNHRTALDPAFQRRLRFIVQFPFPDEGLRLAIWQHAFPARAPLDSIDYAKLARLHATGGSIRNIALNAAFLAADADERIGMAHLLAAAHAEAAKRERPLSEAETRGWA